MTLCHHLKIESRHFVLNILQKCQFNRNFILVQALKEMSHHLIQFKLYDYDLYKISQAEPQKAY